MKNCSEQILIRLLQVLKLTFTKGVYKINYRNSSRTNEMEGGSVFKVKQREPLALHGRILIFKTLSLKVALVILRDFATFAKLQLSARYELKHRAE